MRLCLSFDDVLLAPKHNEIISRGHVDVSTTICGRKFALPFIAANMPSVCGADMANAMAGPGALGIVHRMCSIAEQIQMIDDARVLPDGVGAAIGIGDDWKDRVRALLTPRGKKDRDTPPSPGRVGILCIDVAHGDQGRVLGVFRELLEMTRDLRTGIIVGNIATAAAAEYLVDDLDLEDQKRVALKVGVGGGSVCTTRIRTGFGIPTLQSVIDVDLCLEQMNSEVQIIADGGIKNSGDICKCLAAGADAVMLGSLLAGTDEAPGEVVRHDESLKKIYAGSASHRDKKKFFGRAEYVEGAERLVLYKGPVIKVLRGLEEGLRSGLTYNGSTNISHFQAFTEFVRITPAGYRESLPHGLF